MLRISKLTDYATVLMTVLAQDAPAVLSAVELAARARIELPTASKVLKMLVHAQLVTSFRGASGGYRLARAAAEISVADIVAAIEGPFGMTECVAHAGQCDHEPHCGVRGNWQRISSAIEGALRSVSLAEMVPAKRRSIPVRLLGAGA